MAKVTVYTKNGCPKCNMTKMVLEGEGIKYDLINIEEVDEKTGELTEKAKEGYNHVKVELGISSMPVIEAEGHEVFFGFQPDKLKELK